VELSDIDPNWSWVISFVGHGSLVIIGQMGLSVIDSNGHGSFCYRVMVRSVRDSDIA